MNEQTKMTDGTILQFLDGSHSYEGVWFGDKHPTRTGNFWWRPILREYFKNNIVDAHIAGMEFIPVDPKHYQTDSEDYYNSLFKPIN